MERSSCSFENPWRIYQAESFQKKLLNVFFFIVLFSLTGEFSEYIHIHINLWKLFMPYEIILFSKRPYYFVEISIKNDFN